MPAYISLFFISSAFLLPNIFIPWTTLWLESTSATGIILLTLSLCFQKKITINTDHLVFAIAFLSIIFIDSIIQKNIFLGDYILAFFYVSIFFMALFCGQNFKNTKIIFFFIITASLLSTIIAIMQWLQPGLNNLYIRELPLGGRAFANTGQPNHLSTLLVFGLISIYALQGTLTFFTKNLLIFLLCFGISLTQSRTGILQVIISSIFLTTILPGNLYKKLQGLAPAIFLLICIVFLPLASNLIFIESSRSITESGLQSLRIQHWNSLIESIKINYLWGTGWLGTAKAHLYYSVNPGREGILSYSHNIFLDFFIWFGLIGGSLASFILINLTISFWKSKSTTVQKICWMAFFNALIHSSLEYPFAYIHLLVLAGIFLGISNADSKNNFSICKTPMVTYLFALSTTGVSILYFIVKSSPEIQYLRFKDANIISPEVSIEMQPKIVDQLISRYRAEYTLPHKQMSHQELENYEKAADRFGTKEIVFHAAIANKYLKNEAKANFYLTKLCKINNENICKEYTSQYKNTK